MIDLVLPEPACNSCCTVGSHTTAEHEALAADPSVLLPRDAEERRTRNAIVRGEGTIRSALMRLVEHHEDQRRRFIRAGIDTAKDAKQLDADLATLRALLGLPPVTDLPPLEQAFQGEPTR